MDREIVSSRSFDWYREGSRQVIRMVAYGDTFEWVINCFYVCGFSSAAQFWVFLQLAVPHLAFIAMEGGSMCVSRGTSYAMC